MLSGACPNMTTGDTTQFTLNVGVNPGYFHDNEKKDALAVVTELWQKMAEEVFQSTGIYVGATLTPAKTVYRQEWGCPEGGEDTVIVSGLRNIEFVKDDDLWRTSVSMVALRVGKALKQTTAYLTFAPVEFLYLKPSE